MEKINDLLGKVDTPEMKSDLGSADFANGEFDVYENLARYFQPTSILEIGVYKGQSACSMIYGAKDTLKTYVGVDAEKYLKHSNLPCPWLQPKRYRFHNRYLIYSPRVGIFRSIAVFFAFHKHD